MPTETRESVHCGEPTGLQPGLVRYSWYQYSYATLEPSGEISGL